MSSLLSRSSSTASASSVASLGDGESQLQFNADKGVEASDDYSSDDYSSDEDYGSSYDAMSVNSRGTRVPYSLDDRTLVTSPVLTKIDAELLAPLQSILYLKGKMTKAGVMKKYEEFDFDTFKNIIKETIRELAAIAKGPRVFQRLFWASYDVVRKRRANHVQNWRLYSCPKELIYGGKETFIQKYGDPWALSESSSTTTTTKKKEAQEKAKH